MGILPAELLIFPSIPNQIKRVECSTVCCGGEGGGKGVCCKTKRWSFQSQQIVGLNKYLCVSHWIALGIFATSTAIATKAAAAWVVKLTFMTV